jgi:hypothetical protein
MFVHADPLSRVTVGSGHADPLSRVLSQNGYGQFSPNPRNGNTQLPKQSFIANFNMGGPNPIELLRQRLSHKAGIPSRRLQLVAECGRLFCITNWNISSAKSQGLRGAGGCAQRRRWFRKRLCRRDVRQFIWTVETYGSTPRSMIVYR